MHLRKQILFSILGITFLAQAVFGFLAYRQITESRGDQLTIFLQYLTREIAERLTLPGNQYVAEIYLEELRQKFSTPHSTLMIQDVHHILHIAGNPGQDVALIWQRLNEAYADSDKHGLIELGGNQYYWAVSSLPDDRYQLVMLEPAANEEIKIASVLKLRLISSGFIILCIAIWVSLLLSSKITRKLDEKNQQLKHLAMHDSLTGLPNRKLLTDRLEQLLLQSLRNKQPFALFLIDLNRFKEINDTLGHQFGDEVLKVVSSRLLTSIRENDSIARLGGDEFAVLLPQTDLEGSRLCANRILNAMDPSFSINNITTESKASIGVALFPDHGVTADVLMQYADIAMYQAKNTQTGYAVYDPALDTHSVRRLKLMSDLRDAIEQQEITVHYQPFVSLSKKSIISVEALARWHHEDLGNISPEEFIPMAEQMGLIRALTTQVMEKALKDYKCWSEHGHQLGVGINLSTYCLQDLSLPDDLSSIINRFDVNASDIEFEITEGALMHDLIRAGKILDQLNAAGFKLAIDDFGTGFSSLNYLKELPVSTIKIDKVFISDMCSNPRDNAIVKTIVELGHNLDCRVVAEGVESEMMVESLKRLNVDVVQGFFYSRPVSSEELLDLFPYYDKCDIG